MRRFQCALLAAVAVFGFASVASAADLPVKAPPPAPAPVYSWTGWYVGGNVGYSWGSARSEFDFPGIPVAGGTTGRFSNSDKANLNGAIGGFQAGYNWQTSTNWLWGLETDFQWSGEKGSGSFSHHDEFNFPAGLFFLETDQNTRYTAKITWFGTVRGRLGYVMDRFVIFGTGGFAYGNVKVDGSSTLITTCCSGPGISPTSTVGSDFSESKVKGGWTLGGGIEGVAWDPRWTWKIEYLYLDLGTLRVSEDPLVKVSTKFTDNIVRLGLNFHY